MMSIVEDNMQKRIAVLFIAALVLISCASPAPEPTVTTAPSATHTAAPTATISPPSTETLTPTPTPILLQAEAMQADPYNFTPEQMAGFEKIEKTTITLNGHEVPAIVGVNGSEQTVLAMEVTNFNNERIMARVSVTTDPATGVQYSVFVNPDFDAGDSEGHGDNTGRVMMALGEDGAHEIFFGRYGVFSRFGPAAPNGGKYGPIGPMGLRELVAKSLGVGIEMDTLTQLDDAEGVESTAIMEWEKLPRKVDWGLPTELVFAMDEAGYDKLPEEVKREMVTERDPNNPFGVLFWVGEDGHPIMYVVDRVFFTNGGRSKDLEFQEKATREQTGDEIYRIIWMLGRQGDGQRSSYAYNDSGAEISITELKPLSEEAFDFSIK